MDISKPLRAQLKATRFEPSLKVRQREIIDLLLKVIGDRELEQDVVDALEHDIVRPTSQWN